MSTLGLLNERAHELLRRHVLHLRQSALVVLGCICRQHIPQLSRHIPQLSSTPGARAGACG